MVRYAGTGALVAVAGPAPALLGWSGVALPALRLLGSYLVPVVRFDLEVHRRRVADGVGPELDSDVLTMWEWPESAGAFPGSVVELAGVLVWARGWRDGLGAAQGWRGFGPVAVAGPTGLVDGLSRIGELEFAVCGVGLLEHTPEHSRVVLPATAGRATTARRRVLDRWVEENLYRHALRQGALAGVAG